VTGAELAVELAAMDRRIAERRERASRYPPLPVRSAPRWCSFVSDADGDLLGVHEKTGAAFELDLRHDFNPEDAAVIVARRILRAGGTALEVGRFLDAFDLPDGARIRLRRQLAEAVAG
jgi:hypothetical protein